MKKQKINLYLDNINVLDLGENQGLSVATNWGVYNASSDYVLIVNDDNTFDDYHNWGMHGWITVVLITH